MIDRKEQRSNINYRTLPAQAMFQLLLVTFVIVGLSYKIVASGALSWLFLYLPVMLVFATFSGGSVYLLLVVRSVIVSNQTIELRSLFRRRLLRVSDINKIEVFESTLTDDNRSHVWRLSISGRSHKYVDSRARGFSDLERAIGAIGMEPIPGQSSFIFANIFSLESPSS